MGPTHGDLTEQPPGGPVGSLVFRKRDDVLLGFIRPGDSWRILRGEIKGGPWDGGIRGHDDGAALHGSPRAEGQRLAAAERVTRILKQDPALS